MCLSRRTHAQQDIEPAFVGRKAYYYELLRMLPPTLIPKPAAEEGSADKDEGGGGADGGSGAPPLSLSLSLSSLSPCRPLARSHMAPAK
eukprot:COSAG04_NODE_3404_length_2847_cov_1.460699_3_plen_89_part_00